MPKIVDHQSYRNQLLSGCFGLFASRGFGAATMRSIARHLGVSTGTLYHYFSTKEAIFAALVPQMGTSLIERATRSMADVSRRQRKARLAQFVVDNEPELRDLLSIVIDARRHQGQAEVQQTIASFRAAIADQLDVQAEASARILQRLIGWIVHRMLEPAEFAPPQL